MAEWIKEYGVGIRPISDPFFEEGDMACGMYKREGIVDVDDEFLCHKVIGTFKCELLSCQVEFDSLLKYELHYNSHHRYRCVECKKILPSPHFLDLHVSETHDSFFLAQAERKPMYRCYVETCSFMSKDPKERRSHCIEVHDYPHDFRYDSARHQSQKKKPAKEKKVVENVKAKEDKDKMECDNAKGEKPVHVGFFNFGHRKDKSFKTPKPKKEKPIEMQDLMESLPS